jgi:predicted dehydrogenase
VSKLGLAVIGTGPGSIPHFKSLRDLANIVDVRWVAARRADSLAAVTDYPTTTDVAAAIADPAVNAVLVLTPPSSHLAIARLAFAGGKHVLVEKPLEVSTEAARALVAEGRAASVYVGVVLQQRFRDAGVAMRDLLASGRLGEIQAASVAVPWWRPQSYYDEPGRGTQARDGGGVLLTQAIHTLNMFQSLVGVRAVVAAQVRTTALHRMETEDYASALLELGNGAPGSLLATTALYPGRAESIEIIGTNGTARLEGASLRADFLDGSKLEHISTEGTGGGANIMDFPHDAHRAVIADFVAAVEEGRDPRVTGEDALATQELIEAILAKGKEALLF